MFTLIIEKHVLDILVVIIENMSMHKVENIFQPMNILTSMCLLRNIGTQNYFNKKYSRITFIIIRILLMVFYWYIILKRTMPTNGALDYFMQFIQKSSSGLHFTVIYAAANLTCRHLDNIKTLMKQNSRCNITSIFIPIYAVFLIIYMIVSAMEYELFYKNTWLIFSQEQFVVMVCGGMIHILVLSMFYAVGSFIQQQYQQINEDLSLLCRQKNRELLKKLSKIYSIIHKQLISLGRGFGLFIFCKFVTTYIYVLMSLYHLVVFVNEWMGYHILWIGFVMSELVLVMYYCDRIQNEVNLQMHINVLLVY